MLYLQVLQDCRMRLLDGLKYTVRIFGLSYTLSENYNYVLVSLNTRLALAKRNISLLALLIKESV